MKRWKPLKECPEFNPIQIPKQDKKPQPPQITKKPPPPALPLPPPTTKDPSENYLIRSVLGFAIILLVTFFPWGPPPSSKNMKPYSLSPKEKQYLEQIANINSNKKILFRMAINKNREQLWLASNYKKKGSIFLTLTSIPEKTLSLEKITITSQASLQQGYARFTHFTLVKGHWPIPGEYHAEIHLYPDDPGKQVISWKGLFIVPPKGKRSLSESLERWKKNIHTHYLSPLKKQHQYYQTLKSQLNKMKDFYTKSFQTTPWREFSTLFEQYYNREIGPLLQRFILDGHHLHLSLFNSDSKNSIEYEKIFLYGKKIGALASDMATLTEQSSIKEPEKNRIGKSLLSQLNDLLVQVDSALKNLQEKIDYYQKELPEH